MKNTEYTQALIWWLKKKNVFLMKDMHFAEWYTTLYKLISIVNDANKKFLLLFLLIIIPNIYNALFP